MFCFVVCNREKYQLFNLNPHKLLGTFLIFRGNCFWRNSANYPLGIVCQFICILCQKEQYVASHINRIITTPTIKLLDIIGLFKRVQSDRYSYLLGEIQYIKLTDISIAISLSFFELHKDNNFLSFFVYEPENTNE